MGQHVRHCLSSHRLVKRSSESVVTWQDDELKRHGWAWTLRLQESLINRDSDVLAPGPGARRRAPGPVAPELGPGVPGPEPSECRGVPVSHGHWHGGH